MKKNKKAAARTVAKQDLTTSLYNRFEYFLLEKFDADIEEVRDFEKLLLVCPLALFILLDSIFKFIR